MAARATWYTISGGGDTYWRSEVPARAVGGRLCLMHSDEGQAALSRPTPFAWPDRFSWFQRADGLAVYPHHEGAAVWTRPCLVRALHAAAMQEQGVRTLAEVDDNYLSDSHLNLFMRVNQYGDTDKLQHLRAFGCFDAVVFSTAWLRDRYHKAFRKELGHVPELHVARNNVLVEDWPVRDEGDGRLRVGWMGSAQHARDIKLAYRALAWARADGCEVVLMGQDVRDEEGVTHPRALEACRAWRSVITRHIPWVDPEEYHRTPLPFDIGLAPLELNDHTLGKSDIKMIEYAISGAVGVCSAHPVYTNEWRHNETCLVASSPAEFERCVKELARSRRLRERLVFAAQQFVREERSDAAAYREWSTAIQASS